MNETAEQFITRARSYISDDYLPKLEKFLAAVPDYEIWRRAGGEESNSIGNLLLHLSGSTRMWIISGLGGAPDNRDRQREFDERSQISCDRLLAGLRATVEEADLVLAAFDSDRLLEQKQVRSETYTALEIIFHSVEHFSMHTGQILLLAKMATARPEIESD
jgi:uncharacterized damage-inducible protein DinB